MTLERLRELEWAAVFVRSNPPRACRCAGTCPACAERKKHADKLTPATVLELVKAMQDQHELIGQLAEALVWCSGSADFGPGGKAEEGWRRSVRPVLERALATRSKS